MKHFLSIKIIGLCILLIVSTAFLCFATGIAEEATAIDTQHTEETPDDSVYTRARVTKVLNQTDKEYESSGGSLKLNTQLLEVLILDGPYQGTKTQAEYELSVAFSKNYSFSPLTEGEDVLLHIMKNTTGSIQKAYVADNVKDKYLLYLTMGFLLLLLIVGGLKGFKAIISLILTVFSVTVILLPAILKGWDPIIVSVIICVCIIVITLLIISGYNRKTLSAIIGTASGVIVAGIIALIIGSLSKMTGLGDEDARMLMYIPQQVQLDFRGLLFAGIIIGTMGATMDVGMSIASAMHEIKLNSPQIKVSALFRAGMNVGRDTMATMANTLILAYAGGSLHLMLLMTAYKTPFLNIINSDMMASEILRAIAGSIGIVIAIPITALASAFIEKLNIQDKKTGVDYRSY